MRSKHFLAIMVVSGGLVAAAASGCGGTTNATGTGATTTSTHTTTTHNTTSATTSTTGTGGTGGASGGCHQFSCAMPIMTGANNAVMGTLTDPLTPDYYSFTGTAGDKIEIQALAQGLVTTPGHDPNDPTVTDTVVTLYLPDMTTIWALNDDAWPRLGTDSTLYTELPMTGTYYVTVEDCNALAVNNPNVTCAPAGNITDFSYELGIVDLTTTKGDIPGNTSTMATPASVTYTPNTMMAGTYYADILDGDLATQASVDYFTFTPPTGITADPSARTRAFFWVQSYGSGDGTGTALDVVVTATDGAGHVLAKADQQYFDNGDDATNNGLQLSFPFDSQFSTGKGLGVPYTLSVAVSNKTSIQAMKNFYFMEHYAGGFDYGTPETEGPTGSGMNDTAATAQALTSPTGVTGAFFIDGNLSSPTDVDWFSMAAPATAKTVFLGCEAARDGSGLRGFTAELFKDATGTASQVTIGPEVVGSNATNPNTDLNNGANGTGVSGLGTVTLKVALTGPNAGQDPVIMGTYYHCEITFQ